MTNLENRNSDVSDYSAVTLADNRECSSYRNNIAFNNCYANPSCD